MEGESVVLAPLDESYIPAFLRWLNDPEITRNLLIVRPLTQDEEREWYKSVQGKENEVFFAILLAETGRLIGNCSVTVSWKNRVGKAGIVIGEKDAWDQGHGTEAMGLLVDYCFDELNLNRVELEVYAFNERAIRCYEKVGFVEEGRRRQATFTGGEYHDVVVMGILREDWKQ
ncbi:MAG: GNAT family N-acetyltransferase [Promethearchaeota archaeon]